MSLDLTIEKQLEDFIEQKQKNFTFDIRLYEDKYQELLLDQQLTDQAMVFDEKVIAVLSEFKRKKETFPKKLNILFTSLYEEYHSLSDGVKAKVRNHDKMEYLIKKHRLYFSEEEVFKRQTQFKKDCISYSISSLICLFCFVTGIYLLATNKALTSLSFVLTTIIVSLIGICLIAVSAITIKRWFLLLPTVLLIIGVCVIAITNQLAIS